MRDAPKTNTPLRVPQPACTAARVVLSPAIVGVQPAQQFGTDAARHWSIAIIVNTHIILAEDSEVRTLSVSPAVLPGAALERDVAPELVRQLALRGVVPPRGGTVGLHPAGVLAVADVRVRIPA